jgi:hypothetical protein
LYFKRQRDSHPFFTGGSREDRRDQSTKGLIRSFSFIPFKRGRRIGGSLNAVSARGKSLQ